MGPQATGHPLKPNVTTSTDVIMKFVILLALFALAASQVHHRPGFDHGDPLHRLIHDEVRQVVSTNNGISVDDCSTKCDALFDLNAGHDEEMTDKLCHEECSHQLTANTHPTRIPHHGHTRPN